MFPKSLRGDQLGENLYCEYSSVADRVELIGDIYSC